MNKESITKKDEPKLPSFVKEISTNCINNLNNSLSNRDKESLILKYDFSSINWINKCQKNKWTYEKYYHQMNQLIFKSFIFL